ncbi:MAG: type IV toxin-antitoxin system AbiEi family antitoxin domain-containing protein [Actinobacteria bacterium]|nr:type IV toxin-antitoxin system AbiEi family antitoxin domain-containing protein [Actinomycetota bacterium]
MTATDITLATAAADRHGIVTRGQIRRLGVSDGEVERRVDAGLLVPLHQGVYRHAAVPETVEAGLLATVLGSGDRAVASHRSAAWLHGLRDVPRWRPEVTVSERRLPLLRGVTCHRTDLLEAADVTSVRRIPCTSVPRTLLDLGAVVPFEVVELASQDALIRNLTTSVELVCVLERVGGRGRRGTAALRAVVRASLPPDRIESRLEADLLRLVESSFVPPPVLQHEISLAGGGQARLDLAWPDLRVAVEADGRRWHSTRRDFERDLTRSRAITAAGWRHYRYGWADVHQRPGAVRAELEAVFAASHAA